ncbi:hypothetical protein [Streptomyces sp. SID10815]|nr:hypothetical protein [Streptomyces sp. SID10815]
MISEWMNQAAHLLFAAAALLEAVHRICGGRQVRQGEHGAETEGE